MFLVIASLFACHKEKGDSNIQITISNSVVNKNATGSNSGFLRGTYFHYSFEAFNKAGIISYTISIAPKHQESSTPFYYAKHFETSSLPTLKASDSLWIPDKCGTGNYKITVGITNAEGTSRKALGFFEIAEIYPNPIKISIEKEPEADSTYTTGNIIGISGNIEDTEASLRSVEIFLVKDAGAYDDPSGSICLFEKNNFSNTHSYDFDAYITVGDPSDHALIPKEISSWNLDNAYIVIRVKDMENNLLYSKHFPLRVK